MKHLWTIAGFCIFLAACGSDSSSSSDSSTDSSDSNTEQREDPNEDEDYIQKRDKAYYLDSIWDSYKKEYIRTVQFGSYIWMTENVSQNAYSTNNTCYEESSDNCKRHGRLYMATYAMDACPDGYHVPSTSEWEDLDDFRLESEKQEALINLTYDGYCDTDYKKIWIVRASTRQAVT